MMSYKKYNDAIIYDLQKVHHVCSYIYIHTHACGLIIIMNRIILALLDIVTIWMLIWNCKYLNPSNYNHHLHECYH